MRKLAVGSRVTRHAEVVKLAGIFFVHENAGFSFGAMSIEVKLAHLRLFIDASGMSEGTFVFRLLSRKGKGGEEISEVKLRSFTVNGNFICWSQHTEIHFDLFERVEHIVKDTF